MRTNSLVRVIFPISAALILNFGAWLASGDSSMARLPLLAGILWVIALGLLLYVAHTDHDPQRLDVKEATAIAVLVGVALLVRLYRLPEGPPMLSGNEADVGLASLEYLDGTRTNIFNISWFSFPSLYYFLQSISLRLLNHKLFAIRITSVLAGAMTVGVTYIYAKLTFGRRVALASAVILAFLGYHIHFSRYGLNNIWDGFFAVLLALTLLRAWMANRPAAYVLPGIVLGLAQFFYVGSRVFFIMIPIWMLLMVIINRSEIRHRIAGLVILILSAIAVALPLAIFFIRHPLEYLAPLNRVGIFGKWWTFQIINNGYSPWYVIGDQVLKSFLGFVAIPLKLLYGGQPVLAPPLAAFFLIGLVVLARRCKEPDASWIGLWLLSTMLAVILSVEAPSGQRYMLSSGAIAIVTALGFETVINYFTTTMERRKRVIKILGTLILLITLLWQIADYFTEYLAKELNADINTATAIRIADALQMQDEIRKVYYFGSPRMRLGSNEVTRFLVPDFADEDIADEPQWQVNISGPGKYIFAFLPEREPALNTIIACLPGGEIQRDILPGGPLLSMTYIVHAAEPAICTSP